MRIVKLMPDFSLALKRRVGAKRLKSGVISFRTRKKVISR